MMNMNPDNRGIEFGEPTIGPKVYVARGPSGWAETFKRRHADEALRTFVTPLDLAELIDVFILARQVNKTPADWHTVVGFLARTMQTTPRMVPAEVGVAFWAQVLIKQATPTEAN